MSLNDPAEVEKLQKAAKQLRGRLLECYDALVCGEPSPKNGYFDEHAWHGLAGDVQETLDATTFIEEAEDE